MKRLLVSLFILTLFITGVEAQDAIGTSKREKKVLKLINSLPEIVRARIYMAEHAKEKRTLKAYIESTPTLSKKYYNVSVCDDANDHLFAHYRFRVNAGTYAIYYDDFEHDKLVPLKVWEKHAYGIYGAPAL
ncbi:hypothetical protein ACFGVS_10575 [Mucilaginibacter sp. AW1-7]|uniref:hypothetical protein n=1 Tax=Mucilaginibacter sp. AW1-7 TaxID=3349874 RepID=UPI003F735B6C